MDRVINFNDLKNKAEEKGFDKDIDKFESYIYDLYYDVAAGKLTMADFTKEMMKYMSENNISQDKFLKMQTKLMERYGFDASSLENQLKNFGISNVTGSIGDVEKARKSMSFQEKYKDRIELKAMSTYFIKNSKNDVSILVEENNVILKSFGKIDLADLELNEFLCSYKKVVENKSLNISICENAKEYNY